MRRGEIYWVNLDPTIGAEIRKTRPALIISNDIANRYSSVVTILPITSNFEKIYPFEVRLEAGEGGLRKPGVVKVNQVRTVDKQRIIGKPLGGHLSGMLMAKVEQALKVHFDIT